MCDHLTSLRRPVSRMSHVTVAVGTATVMRDVTSRTSRDLIEAPYQAIMLVL